MMDPMDPNAIQYQRKPNYVVPIIAGVGAFVIGVGVTFGYVQWQAQQEQLARMSLMLEEMQRAGQNEVVTRNAPVELLSLAPAATPAPMVEPAPIRVAVPAPKEPAEDLAISTADRIRELVSRSADPLVSAAIAQSVARRETMSIAIQGVNELVAAATAGEYNISTNGKNADGTGGRLRIVFPSHAEDQAQLEQLLASAAQAGMIAFNDSVKGSDGSFDGRVILFDLVERALLNGTDKEQRTGKEIRQKAVSLLAGSNTAVPTLKNADGQRFYTVQSGDSLAYIALQFYGNTNDYRRIFKANTDVLSTPDKIQIGQKLLIPTI